MARKQTPKQTPAQAPAPVAAAPAPVAANPAQVLAQALLARAAAPTVGTLPQAPAPAQAAAVAVRGGLAIVAVALAKPYRVQAGHNLQWLQIVQAQVAAGGGKATVQALLAAGVPAPFVGYMVRRGYAVAVS